jgi:hypothetical protein
MVQPDKKKRRPPSKRAGFAESAVRRVVIAADKARAEAALAADAARKAQAALAARPAGPLKAVQAELQSRKERWVVLLYMAVTSPELREVMERDLRELATRLNLLSSDALRVYALMDTPDGQYGVRHRLHQSATGEPALTIMRPKDSVARRFGQKAAFLAKLIDWRFSPEPEGEFKTEVSSFGRTLLVLWGHSQGVATALSMPGSPAYSMIGNGGFGFNEFSGDSLSLPQIRRAVAEGLHPHPEKRIDVLSFDSCFMGAAEVSAEFQPSAPSFVQVPKDAAKAVQEEARAATKAVEDIAIVLGDEPARVDYVVASQSAVLLDGLDYGRLVDVFINAGDQPVSAEDLGRGLLEQASATTNSPVSLSLLYTGPSDRKDGSTPYQEFSAALRELVEHLCRVLDTDAVAPTPSTPAERPRRTFAAAKAGRFAANPGANRSEWLRIRDAFESATWHRVRQFIDVADLCRRLANNCRTTGLRVAALKVLKSLQRPEEHAGQSLVVDVRSLHPLLLSGMSLYCPWVYPSPEEVRKGAWNAVVDLYDYATSLWFNRGDGSWGAFVYHAKHVLEESRQRAINTELSDLRDGTAPRASSALPPAAPSAATSRGKEGQDKFQTAERPELLAGVSAGAALPPIAAASVRTDLATAAATQGAMNRVSICPTRRD